MSETGGRQFKDFAGYLWEAFEVRGREGGVPPGFRRIFFRSLDHPELPPVPGPITTAPLHALSLEQLRSFIKLRHALPLEGAAPPPGPAGPPPGAAAAPTPSVPAAAPGAPPGERALGARRPGGTPGSEWETFLRAVQEEPRPTPGAPEPAAPTAPLPSAGSGPRPTDAETPPRGLEEHDASLYPSWLLEALETGAEPFGPEAPGAPETPGAAASPGGPAPGATGTPESAGAPGAAEPGGWVPQEPVHRRHLYRGFESSRLIPRRYQARVRLALHDREFVGEAEGADVPGARVEVAARATLAALQKAEDNRVELALQGAKVVRAFDRSVVVVGVYGLKERDVTFLVGASLVRDSLEHAAILATLQATGRWLAWAASQPPNGGRPHRNGEKAENPTR